jgi:hypothetical protein
MFKSSSEKLHFTPLKLAAIFNSTLKILIFAIHSYKVLIFFNLAIPSVKAALTNGTMITCVAPDHFWPFTSQNTPIPSFN